jgi:hypothetical protein
MSENNRKRRERLRRLHRELNSKPFLGSTVKQALIEIVEQMYEDDGDRFEGQTLFETDDEARARLGLGEKAA